jgi:hypothetical protein
MFKRNLIWILFFGSLIGLNETLVASLSLPSRSIVLSSITLSILSFARLKIPQMGTSILIISIAVLFKINNMGVSECSTSVFLCGPTALLLLGICYELFAALFISKDPLKYTNYLFTCGITSIIAFSMFALMNTYILKSWSTDRFFEYIFVKAALTAAVSSIISMIGIYLARTVREESFLRLNPYIINGVLSIVVIALWVFGSLTKY